MTKTKSQPSQFIFMESGKILRSSLLENVAGIPFRNTIFFHLFLMTIFSISMTGGNPVKGIIDCLNNEDCLGANRICHRNVTMKTGLCICRPGYIKAVGERIKCLHQAKKECHTSHDCENNFPCLPLSDNYNKEWSHELLTTVYKHYRRSYGVKKYCMGSTLSYAGLQRNDFDSTLGGQVFQGSEHPRTGGGLLPGTHEDHFNNRYVRVVSRNNAVSAGLNPEYIKFVEDCMLVLFLLCVLITLLVVHRASCARQFRRARRDGPLRYIIPHADDQPPPYANYAPPPDSIIGNRSVTNNDGDVIASRMVTREVIDEIDGGISSHTTNSINMASHVQSILGVSRKSAETPPPTYDEALAISQALSASMVASDIRPSSELSANPSSLHSNFQQTNLYINLPSPPVIDTNANQSSLPASSTLVSSRVDSNSTQVASSGIRNENAQNDNQSNSNAADHGRPQSYQNSQGAPELDS